MFGGGVSMREAQIYIKKQKKEKKQLHWVVGFSSLNWGGGYTPLGGCKNITDMWVISDSERPETVLFITENTSNAHDVIFKINA